MNDQTQNIDAPMDPPVPVNSPPTAVAFSETRARAVTPEGDGATCGCEATPGPSGGTAVSYVYAIGRIDARFPTLAVEKEFMQAAGRTDNSGRTDRQTLHAVLSKPENRYLARKMCWVLTVQGLDTYILSPRDPRDFERLVDAIRPEPSPLDLDVVIGVRGPIAPPTLCNGLMVPIVGFDQMYSFDRDALLKAIPRPEKTKEKQFEVAAAEVLDRILQMTDNAGATDDHRALNYLAMRYPAIYSKTAEEFAKDFSLSGVDVRSSPLGGTRNINEVVFSYTNRMTDYTEKFSVRVDVTEEFPFLVTKLSPYFDR
jgi:cyclic patellamide precursor peptide PatG